MGVRKAIFSLIWFVLPCVLGIGLARAGLATDITGLYYTGTANNGSLLAGGATDSHWSVTYARVGGSNFSGTSTYTGPAYVVKSATNNGAGTNYIDYAWVQNAASYQWITAPGSRETTSTSSTANSGGVYLPGNGDSGTNRAQYIYTLAFNISGTGTGTITNAVSINLTIAADDQFSIYINPTLNANGSIATGQTAAFTGYSAWNNTTTANLNNGTNGTGTSGNSVFKVGTNYLVVVVDNTNSLTGSQSSTALNPSGLLMYQVGTAMTIDGRPVPEPATAAAAVFMAFFAVGFHRRRRPAKSSAAPRE